MSCPEQRFFSGPATDRLPARVIGQSPGGNFAGEARLILAFAFFFEKNLKNVLDFLLLTDRLYNLSVTCNIGDEKNDGIRISSEVSG